MHTWKKLGGQNEVQIPFTLQQMVAWEKRESLSSFPGVNMTPLQALIGAVMIGFNFYLWLAWLAWVGKWEKQRKLKLLCPKGTTFLTEQRSHQLIMIVIAMVERHHAEQQRRYPKPSAMQEKQSCGLEISQYLWIKGRRQLSRPGGEEWVRT